MPLIRPAVAAVVVSLLFCPAPSRAEKTEIVNQQLDDVERQFSGNIVSGDVDKEFSHGQNAGARATTQVPTRTHTFEADTEAFYYRYQEPEPGVKLWGPMVGFNAGYAYRPKTAGLWNNPIINVYTLQARYSYSHDLTYKGSGIFKGKHDNAAEFRGLIGKDYFIGPLGRVTPYLGFGWRYLFDHGDGDVNDQAYLYDRKSHYYYLPIGTDAAIAVSKSQEVDLNLEYEFLIYGLQKSYLSQGFQFNGGLANPNLKNRQMSGYGLRGSVKFVRHSGPVDFFIEPYVRYWSIARSNLVAATVDGQFSASFNEPKNNTTEIGSRFGVEF